MDMADKYPPAESFEKPKRRSLDEIMAERDTLPPSDWDEPTLVSERNPLMPKEEKRYPGIGLLIAFGTGILFWGAVFFYACH